MDKFIKVTLVGQGWSESQIGKQQDYQRVANLIANHLRGLTHMNGTAADSRNISISVCDQLDKIHFLDTDQQLVFKI